MHTDELWLVQGPKIIFEGTKAAAMQLMTSPAGHWYILAIAVGVGLTIVGANWMANRTWR